jgi:hypothetical protein
MKPRARAGARRVELMAGRAKLELELATTDTVDRLVAALPLFSTAELWGEVVHFEVPVRSGRDRTARINAMLGEVFFWAEEERIIVPFGPSPISRENECRLPAPCNVIGRVIGDLAALTRVRPGEKAALRAITR